MAHYEQTQWHCNRCGTVTLHSALVEPFNHILHLLVSALLCGCWLPVWALAAIAHNPRRDQWRCTLCGQRAGEFTPQQQLSLHVEHLQLERQRDIELVLRDEQKHLAHEQRREHFEQAASTFRQQVRELPWVVDRACRTIAGEDNDIIYHFLQTIVVILCLSAVCAVFYGFYAIALR